MRVLGISGAFDAEDEPYLSDLHPRFFHDAAAALVVDGAVVAAMEEERFNREKHSNRFPRRAIAACLAQGGLSLGEVDRVAYFFAEPFTDAEIARECASHPDVPTTIRDLIARHLADVKPDRITFHRHHEVHAAGVLRYAPSGPSLVLVMDGNGEAESTSVFHHDGESTTLLRTHPVADSFGHFYTALTEFLGFGDFDEYKVMGLAAYGEPKTVREALRPLLHLGDEGQFTLDRAGLAAALTSAGYQPRAAGEPVGPAHAAVAAAGQRLLEEAVLHVVRYWHDVTGLDTLCVTGGVAQNTSLNGRLLTAGPFRRVVVDPAGHDGGAALGAALAASAEAGVPRVVGRAHLYLGPSVGGAEELAQRLADWSSVVTVERPDSLVDTVADLLADGTIVGWVRGRSEFGPRALGNRSILADPRPAANRDRVNALIKERESFRPLAPAVLAGAEREFFDLPDREADLRFMGFVVPVRSDAVDRLGAVSHVDGTARVQVVEPTDNPDFASLLTAFGQRTGIPVLLNTSFNTNAEPIVQSLDDAVACLLTSQLGALAVGPYLVRRREGADAAQAALDTMPVCLRPLCEVIDADGVPGVQRRGRPQRRTAISGATVGVLHGGTAGDDEQVRAELLDLWRKRLVQVAPEVRR